MSELERTLANLAPGVTHSRDISGSYNPRRGLAIYCLPISGYSPASPGFVLGEALAARSGLGCTMLEGIPVKIPEGAVVVGEYAALAKKRPELLKEIPELRDPCQYAIRLCHHAVITATSKEGLAAGMQTLAMLVLRHNDSLLPGSVIVDIPFCQSRGLVVELRTPEININLLMQIVSFAATFKANRLHLILDEDFDPAREIPGVESFAATCLSYGIDIGVRLPWLNRLFSGKKSIHETWSAVRAAARVFGATQAGLDDPCPMDANPSVCRRIAESLIRGEVGLREFSLDVGVLMRAECTVGDLAAAGVFGWHRLWDNEATPRDDLDLPLQLDVQAPLPGFSSRGMRAFFRRLDAASAWLRRRDRRSLMVSFRDIGVSHMWQNLLYPAATGLIASWGRPEDAAQCAWLFSNLLYGDHSVQVMDMWDAVGMAFPPGLSAAQEILVRRTAFGRWPEESDGEALSSIDWLEVAQKIRTAAESLKNIAADLSRNAATLTGARLSLFALSWLHCFLALTPELERRRASKYDEDGRTEPIAAELYNNFLAWQGNLQNLAAESGLEIGEMAQVESMGLRLKGLCEGIFE